MALADTAKLIVSLDLKGNLGKGLDGINRQIDNLSRNATVRGGLGQISQGIGVGLRNSAVIGAAGVALLSTQIRAGVESLRELENAEAQTAAALKSTNGVSGQTAEGIRALSEEYETLGGVIDDKVIQAGANVLLTFRRVNKDAFQPALLAALDLSTALGTDLQGAVLQVGKALEDPISGITALRRAGVQFTDAQQDQIKALVEANDLYGAQQLILDELAVQVGGRFAAAGKTNEATVARMGDAWEDLQQTLTRAALPAIDKVARRLTAIFSDQAVIAGVSDFGDRLAGFLTTENLDRAEDAIRGTFGYLASIPWGAIGDGLRIAGQAASVAVGAFKSLPPGVQNALITLLAANKLTGGLVASGLGQLASVALGSLKTITAGHVTVVGPVSTGPVGIGGAAGGGLLGGLKTGVALAAPVLAGVAAVEVVNFQNMRTEAISGLEGILDDMPRKTGAEIDKSISAIEGQISQDRPLLEGILFNTNVKPVLEKELAELQQVKAATERGESATRDAIPWLQRNQAEIHNLNASEGTRAANLLAITRPLAGSMARTAAASERTANKNFSPIFDPKVIVNLTNNVSATVLQNRIVSLRSTIGGGGFI